MSSEITLVILYLAFLKTYTNILSFVLPKSFNHLPWPLSNPTLTTHKPIAWPGLPTIQIPTYVKPKQKPSTSEEDAERARRAEIREREAQEKEAEDARKREEERQRRRETNGNGKPRWEDPYGIPPERAPVGKDKPLVPVPWDF